MIFRNPLGTPARTSGAPAWPGRFVMLYFELLLLRLLVWVGAPLLLAVLAVGPRRVGRWFKRGWTWLWEKRLDPGELLTRVVREQEQRIAALRQALQQAEATETEIARNARKSE